MGGGGGLGIIATILALTTQTVFVGLQHLSETVILF